MDKKLAITLDEELLNRAKAYSRAIGTSLSKFVESYLYLLTSQDESKPAITPLVKSLIGVIDLKWDNEPFVAYKDHLVEKYL